MSLKFEQCSTCRNTSSRITCDGCGTDITGAEDAVRIDVHRVSSPGQRSQLDYCLACAAKQLPAAVGRGAPGSDLPASFDPPEEP